MLSHPSRDDCRSQGTGLRASRNMCMNVVQCCVNLREQWQRHAACSCRDMHNAPSKKPYKLSILNVSAEACKILSWTHR